MIIQVYMWIWEKLRYCPYCMKRLPKSFKGELFWHHINNEEIIRMKPKDWVVHLEQNTSKTKV